VDWVELIGDVYWLYFHWVGWFLDLTSVWGGEDRQLLDGSNGLGRKADFSASAANAPPSVEMTVLVWERGVGKWGSGSEIDDSKNRLWQEQTVAKDEN
jgi:hypothetical protein